MHISNVFTSFTFQKTKAQERNRQTHRNRDKETESSYLNYTLLEECSTNNTNPEAENGVHLERYENNEKL